MEEKLHVLVSLGENSPLKTELNRGVASLRNHPKAMFMPHVCLNGLEGMEVLRKIMENPDGADTQFWIDTYPVKSAGDLWLNICFMVFLDKISWPRNVARLTPQQSGYIVRNLSAEPKKIVLDKIKTWYFKIFIPDIQKGIEAITKQFNEGDPLVQSDHGNRIFDIHGGRAMDGIPYVEPEIAGVNLFYSIVLGGTCFEHGSNGYERADQLIVGRRKRQKAAVDTALGLAREFF